jgi:hypothetical protein
MRIPIQMPSSSEMPATLDRIANNITKHQLWWTSELYQSSKLDSMVSLTDLHLVINSCPLVFRNLFLLYNAH